MLAGRASARAALGHSARYHEAGYDGSSRHALLDAALAAIGEGDSPRRVQLLSRLAGSVAFAADQGDRAAQVSAEALAMARRLGDESLVLTALMAERGATVMLERRDVFLGASRADVTEEAIAAIDEAIGAGASEAAPAE